MAQHIIDDRKYKSWREGVIDDVIQKYSVKDVLDRIKISDIEKYLREKIKRK